MSPTDPTPTQRPADRWRGLRLAAAWGYLAVMTALLVLPDPSVVFGPPSPQPRPHADKVVHGGGYVLLMLAMAWAYRPRRGGRALAWIFCLVAAHGVLTELAQLPSPKRQFSAWDLAADWLGAGLAALLVLWWRRRAGA